MSTRLYASASKGLFCLLGAGVVLSGCVSDEPFPGNGSYVPEGTLTAIFTLTVPNLSAVTRAPDEGESVAPGENMENYIDLPSQDYRFLFFDNAGKYVETLEVRSLVKMADVDYDLTTTYLVEGVISRELALKSGVKVMALANWGEYYIPRDPGETTIQDICRSQGSEFEYTLKSKLPSADDRIPMFGITNSQSFTFDPSTHQAKMDPVCLLRAYSKIEVEASFDGYSDLDKCELTGVTLTGYNKRGFKAPAGVTSHDDYVAATETGALTSSGLPLNIPAGHESETSVSFMKREGADNTYILYVPEYQNLTVEGNRRDRCAGMQLFFNVPDRVGNIHEEKAPLEFKYYSDLGPDMKEGRYFNISRNVWYKYHVNKSPTAIKVDLQPFALAELNPSFGLSRDKDGNILVRDENGKLINIIPYTPGVEAKLEDIDIGGMSYVQVWFNDVLQFREFVDDKGKPTGERQDFLASGWNFYNKNGVMTRCFIFNKEKGESDFDPGPDASGNYTNNVKGTYLLFDEFSNLIEKYENATESHNWTSATGGTQKVWTVYVDGRDDYYKIYYEDPAGGNPPLQTIMIVYAVKGSVADRDHILTVLIEEGDANLTKEYFTTGNDVVEDQRAVQVYEEQDGLKYLRYMFLNDGSYQVLHVNSITDGEILYDWDYYTPDGWRYSGFDHNHRGYDNTNVYSRYDEWGNLISRSINASYDADRFEGTHNTDYMVVDNREEYDAATNSQVMIIMLRQKKSDGTWDWTDAGWKDQYRIWRNGEKEVIPDKE